MPAAAAHSRGPDGGRRRRALGLPRTTGASAGAAADTRMLLELRMHSADRTWDCSRINCLSPLIARAGKTAQPVLARGLERPLSHPGATTNGGGPRGPGERSRCWRAGRGAFSRFSTAAQRACGEGTEVHGGTFNEYQDTYSGTPRPLSSTLFFKSETVDLQTFCPLKPWMVGILVPAPFQRPARFYGCEVCAAPRLSLRPGAAAGPRRCASELGRKMATEVRCEQERAAPHGGRRPAAGVPKSPASPRGAAAARAPGVFALRRAAPFLTALGSSLPPGRVRRWF